MGRAYSWLQRHPAAIDLAVVGLLLSARRAARASIVAAMAET